MTGAGEVLRADIRFCAAATDADCDWYERNGPLIKTRPDRHSAASFFSTFVRTVLDEFGLMQLARIEP